MAFPSWQHRIRFTSAVCHRLRPQLRQTLCQDLLFGYRFSLSPSHSVRGLQGVPPSKARFMATDNVSQPHDDLYIPEVDLEDFENYTVGGYHPTKIGDTFHNGRYEYLDHYVSLKILVADETPRSTEGAILLLLSDSASTHPGRRFIPQLLECFQIEGPNGHHVCLVQNPAGCSLAASREDSTNLMFPVETARSIAAQLIMAVSYLHSKGVCHGDLHTRNFLLCGPSFDGLGREELYRRFRLDKAPISKFDGSPVEPHAPPFAVYPIHVKMPADKVSDPIIKVSDYGTSFVVSAEKSPELHTPALYLPPEDFFGEPITQAADIWTLGVNLYEVLGERALFETFGWDRDEIMADMVSTLGQPPGRYWDAWKNRSEFFEPDGSWVRNINRVYTPGFRPLHQRMWDMGRGETPTTCQWDVKAGEMRSLEELLKGMLVFDPAERFTAEQMMNSEYMVKWAMPAWERQKERQKEWIPE